MLEGIHGINDRIALHNYVYAGRECGRHLHSNNCSCRVAVDRYPEMEVRQSTPAFFKVP